MLTAISSPFLQMMPSRSSRSFCDRVQYGAGCVFVMVCSLAIDNSSSRLLSLRRRTAAAAFSGADHLFALLARGDTVGVAFEDLLAGPSHDGRSVLGCLELLCELLFELCDVRHVRLKLADKDSTFARGGRLPPALWTHGPKSRWG